jgi:carboxyl-terminal processing protease
VDELEEEQRLAALEKKRKPLEYGGKDDFQLAQAMNYLKGQPVQLSKNRVVESKKEQTINNKDDKVPANKTPVDKAPADKAPTDKK